MASLDPSISLRFLGEQIDDLASLVETLSEHNCEQVSNCPGWNVSDVATHIVRNGESVLFAVLSVAFGAADEVPMVHYGPTTKGRDEDIRALRPNDWAHLLRSETAAFIALLSHMTPQQLERTTRHPSGIRPAGWFAHSRLAEVAFHFWDIRSSLGAPGPMDEELASHALGFMVDPRYPIPARLQSTDLTERHVLLKTPTGASWPLTLSSKGLAAQSLPRPRPEIEVEAPAGWLALAVYGRVRISEPAFTVTGPSWAADYFATAFGQPTA